MEHKKTPETQEKISRILYLLIIAVLCITAVAIGITAAANRGNKVPVDTTAPPVTTTARPVTTAAPVTTAPANVLPEFQSPAVGVVAKEHDPTVQVFSNTLGEWRVHLGIDIMTEAAAPVYPTAKGKIKQIADDPMWGKCIWIEHDGDAVSVYRGLADELPAGIEVGAKVNEDTLIGAVGEGGVLELADEPHLHFEMKIKGADVDPIEYFSKSALETLRKNQDTTYEG
jgi:murein DD-endopeptidase MepM/ murein hydrolase activator NlpD